MDLLGGSGTWQVGNKQGLGFRCSDTQRDKRNDEPPSHGVCLLMVAYGWGVLF